jgi:hypothetical protein
VATKRKASWVRAIVPRGYATATLEIEGLTPMLMNSGDADRESELYRAYILLGQKLRKTLEDEARLREMDWQLRLYIDPELGPFIPSVSIKKVLRDAATKWKKGEDVKRSLVVRDHRVPLVYDGPRDMEGLWEAGYRYTALVQNLGMNAGRVVRCRPMFESWSISTEIAYDPEDLDYDQLELIVERAQKYGLGDYRPVKGGNFGMFAGRLVGPKSYRGKTNGRTVEAASALERGNHEAFVEAITGS